jgi:hypothetical protein
MIFDKLIDVQSELKVPKNQYNSFGKYKYRSVEDIQEAAKPVLKKYGLCLTITDEINQIGDRFFVKATASICDPEDGTHHEATSSAGIDFTKKGMDASQVVGCASSYARKYALNALFLLDDSKLEPAPDPDRTPLEKEHINDIDAKSLHDRCGGDKDLEGFILKGLGVKAWKDLTYEVYQQAVENWDKMVEMHTVERHKAH